MSESFVPAEAERDPTGVMFTPVPRDVVLELHAMITQADALIEQSRNSISPLERAAITYQQVQARALVVLLASMVIDDNDE